MQDVRSDLQNGMSIAETCQKYKMSFKELIDVCNHRQYQSYALEVEDGIYIRNSRYFVYSADAYCSFIDLDEARYVRDTQPPVPKCLGDTYVSKKRKSWCIQRTNRVHQGHYGAYESREIARKVRDKLVLCNWDKRQLPKIKKELGL